MGAPPSTARTIVSASAALTVATMPVFLIGALSGEISDDLGLGEAAVGGAATMLLGTAGVAATAAGRLTERIGAPLALRLGVLVAGAATAAVGLFATRWWHIAVPFACVGVAVGLIDTGTARTFADHVRRRWQGTAFGIKEASVPAGSLLAGVALPTVAGSFGWRTTFVAAVGVAVAVLLALPRWRRTTAVNRAGVDVRTDAEPIAEAVVSHGAAEPDDGQDHTHGPASGGRPEAAHGTPAEAEHGDGRVSDEGSGPPVSRGAMLRFAIAAGVGSGSVTAGATFLVPTATTAGLGSSMAGAVLSVASLASIAVRIVAGRLADREDARPARVTTWLMLVGGLGAGLLAIPDAAAIVTTIGAIVALGAGWGWTGLAFFAAIRARPTAPAAAAGVVLTGLGVGGALGPLLFGTLVEAGTYTVAWAMTAGALLVAGVLAGSTTAAFRAATVAASR